MPMSSPVTASSRTSSKREDSRPVRSSCRGTRMSERPVPGVGVAVIDAGRLLVVRKDRGPWADHWAVPGGRVEMGERMADAAIR
ncbi:MAG: NUDIX domain-containing protein, partial [Acidimicrobiia bacterium]